MDDSQTLELQVKSKAQEALSSVDKLVSKLTGLERTISGIDSKLKTSSVNNANSNVNQLKNTIDKTTSSANKLGSSLKAVFTYAGVKRLTTTLLGWMDEAVNYTEQLNLFNVVFNNIEKNGKKTFSALGEEATRFQYKLNEKFGTNKTETLYMQGIFQSMGETVGIKDKYSAIMSETMTKLTYDLASLYNKGEEATAEAIRAGVYAGQTKPLRAFGIDVTQMSMQPILNELGIDSQVKELSQAEKEILRYLATLKQAKIAMGDFANNLESPANQMKIFKQQLVETKVALSSLFIGTFAKILPYANAILMVIKEVTKAIATMFGIELKDYNTGIASQEGVYDGIADSAGKATKKAKELKRTLFGWDEVHNIDENKDSGSGSGTSVGGGIDQRLLDAIKGYDNGMDKVRMKATEIRDKIMEWLGFTKEIDPLTGAVSFKYGGIKKTLSNIVGWWKELNLQGKIFVGLGIGLTILKIYGAIKKIASVLGIQKMLAKTFSVFGKLFGGVGKIITATKLFSQNTLSVKTILDITFPSISKVSTGFSGLASALGISAGAFALIIGAVLAIAGALIYAYKTNDTFKNKVNEMVSTVKGLFTDLFNSASKACYEILEIVKPVWSAIKETVVSAVKYMYESIVLNFSLIFDIINGTCKIISDLIHGDFGKAFDDAKQMAKDLFGDWNTWFEKIKEIFGNLTGKIIDSIFEFVPKAISKMGDILTWIKELPTKFFYYAGLAVGALIKKITETDWKAEGKKVLTGIVSGIKNIGSSLSDFGSKLWNKTWESIKSIKWRDLGKNILDGIIGGMFNIGKSLKNWSSSFVKGIKDALGIHSPSRLVIDAKVGDYTTEGIIVGMKREVPKLKNTANLMVDEIEKTFDRGDYDMPLAYNLKNELPNLNPDCSVIQEIIVNGMSQIMSQFGGQEVQVDIYAHTDEGVIVDRINQKTKQTGVCPINIPVY